MARYEATEELDFGGDSFLDIVANVVGILIILILVVGMQIARSPAIQADARRALEEQAAARRAAQPAPDPRPVPAVIPEVEPPAEVVVAPAATPEPKPPRPAASPQLLAEVQNMQARLAAVAQGFMENVAMLRRMQIETAARANERQRLATELAIRRDRLQRRAQELDASAQEQFAMKQELDRLNATIGQIDEQLLYSSAPQQVVEIRHEPTTLSRTVYSDEQHFRIEGNRVTALPIDRLVDRVRGDIDRQAWKLRDGGTVNSSVGPIEGFTMSYTLATRRVVVDRPDGSQQVGTIAEVVRWELLPSSSALGESIDDAVKPGSQFLKVLDRSNPQRTTLTVWVYPDGFQHFRRLKEEATRRGFAIAGRPLPQGVSIAGSPNGSRSSAQ